jgi:hypothetical protein
MFVRFLVRRREHLSSAGRQLVADVKRGEGFTFHRELTRGDPVPTNDQNGGHGKQRLTPATPPRVLALREWLNLVNHHPDEVPHLFIEGGSGSGKTTLATAILHDRLGPIAIVGVKPDDGWSLDGVGYTYRSTEREAALKQLLTEVRRRLDDGDKRGLTIVLDDFTRLASDHSAALDLYKLIADVGRSLRIRLILIARGRQVKGIGASGESDLLDHFVFLTVQRGHRATLEYDEERYPLDTGRVAAIARPLPAARFWQAENVPQPSRESALLSRLLQADTPPPVSSVSPSVRPNMAGAVDTSMPGMRGTSRLDASTLEMDEEDDTEGIPAKLTPEAIQTLYGAWRSKSKIAAMLSGKKQKRLAIIDAALAQEQEAQTVN